MGLYNMKKATGYCLLCNVKLLIPSWLRCTKCELKPVVEYVPTLRDKKTYPERHTYMGYSHTFDLKTFVNAKTFVVDNDRMEIIGFK